MPSFIREKQRLQKLFKGSWLSQANDRWLPQAGLQYARSRWPLVRAQLETILPSEWQVYLAQPRWLGQNLERRFPELAKYFLSAASICFEPFLAGMGMTVAVWDETLVDVRLPHRWKNRSEGGEIHVGALLTLAEFTSRLFWERHLDPQMVQLRVQNVQSQFFRKADRGVRAVLKISEVERESLLFRLRSEQHLQTTHEVMIYDDREQMVAQVSVHWELAMSPVLNPGRSQHSASHVSHDSHISHDSQDS